MKLINKLMSLNSYTSIQAKIMGIVIFLILVLAFGINYEVRAKTSSLLEKQLIQHATSLTNNVAYMITEPVLTNNIFQLHSIMDKMVRQDPNVRYYFILNKEGNILLSSFSEGLPKDLVMKNSPNVSDVNLTVLKTEEGIIWDIAAPIAKGFGGTLRIGVTEKYRIIGLHEVSQKILLSTLVVILLSIAVAYLLTKALTYPIVQLVNFAETMGQGNYDAKLKINRWANREIVTLLGSFNEMANNILETSSKMEVAQKARKTLLQKIINVQEEERARVARELHDETNQCLAAINLGLDRMCEEDDVTKSKHLSKELQKIVMQASTDLKRLAWELRPSAIDKVGLTLAIQNYVDNFMKNYKINVNCICELTEHEGLDGDVSIVVYRIIQETLTNIVKHAKADQVEIILTKAPERLMVIIEDNGRGFDPDKVLDFEKKTAGKITSLGLYGMMERAELIGGNLLIESEPGQGTTVYLTVPLVEGVNCNEN